MLTFLRTIRRSLIESGSARKYLLYAIGEIALVVIGILIALQINNRNEEKQAEKFELKLLSELKETIVEDYSTVERIISYNERDLSSCKLILEHLDGDLPFDDSLLIHFRNANNWSKIMLRHSAFENAKSHGLHFIKDDTTRHSLTQLYEWRVVWSDTLDHRQTEYYYNTVVPELTNLFEFTSAPSLYRTGVSPYDYESLKRNEKYRNILKSNIMNRQHEINWQQGILEAMKQLESKLQSEIDSR